MKLNVDEFKNKYKEKITDNDLLIELLEDVTDSYDDSELNGLKEALQEKDTEIAELKQKYIDRFYEVSDDDKKEEDPGLEEKEVIDVKEI